LIPAAGHVKTRPGGGDAAVPGERPAPRFQVAPGPLLTRAKWATCQVPVRGHLARVKVAPGSGPAARPGKFALATFRAGCPSGRAASAPEPTPADRPNNRGLDPKRISQSWASLAGLELPRHAWCPGANVPYGFSSGPNRVGQDHHDPVLRSSLVYPPPIGVPPHTLLRPCRCPSGPPSWSGPGPGSLFPRGARVSTTRSCPPAWDNLALVGPAGRPEPRPTRARRRPRNISEGTGAGRP